VYAQSLEKFDSVWEKLEEYPTFRTYMEANWLSIKAWWVYYEHNSHMNLGNTTNNRTESVLQNETGSEQKVQNERVHMPTS